MGFNSSKDVAVVEYCNKKSWKASTYHLVKFLTHSLSGLRQKKNQGFIIFMAFLQFFKNVMKTFRDRLEISLLRLSEVKLVNQFYSPWNHQKNMG